MNNLTNIDDLAIMIEVIKSSRFIFVLLFICLPAYTFMLHKTIEEYYTKKYLKVLEKELTLENQFKVERRVFSVSIPLIVLWCLVILKNIFEWIITL